MCFLLRPPLIDCFSSSIKCPSNLFSRCFATVLFIACFADFFVANSNNSGAPCTSNSLPIVFAAGKINRRARGNATRPMPAANALNPIPLCL